MATAGLTKAARCCRQGRKRNSNDAGITVAGVAAPAALAKQAAAAKVQRRSPSIPIAKPVQHWICRAW